MGSLALAGGEVPFPGPSARQRCRKAGHSNVRFLVACATTRQRSREVTQKLDAETSAAFDDIFAHGSSRPPACPALRTSQCGCSE